LEQITEASQTRWSEILETLCLKFLCCSIYLFCIVLCIVFVLMCTVLLPSGGYPIAVNKYIIMYHIRCLLTGTKLLSTRSFRIFINSCIIFSCILPKPSSSGNLSNYSCRIFYVSMFYNWYSDYFSINFSSLKNNVSLEFLCRKGHLTFAADSVRHSYQYSLRSTWMIISGTF
jgi:hypothetical protein